MKKNCLRIGFILAVMAGLLSACADESRVTEEEQAIVAEYIAHMLLKHDKSYQDRLADTMEVKDNPSVVEEEFSVIGEDSSENDTVNGAEDDSQGEALLNNGSNENSEPGMVQQITLSDIFKDTGIEVSFAGYEEHEVYPENETDAYFSLVAPEGKKWAVMKFLLRNGTESERKFSQLNSSVRYRLDLDTKTVVKPSMTLMVNDLQYMDITLAPSEETIAVVVFSVSESAKLKGANLWIYTDTESAIEKLQ